MAGEFLSPYVLLLVGQLGVFVVQAVILLFCLIYLFWFVSEPIADAKKPTWGEDGISLSSLPSLIRDYVWKPFTETLATVMKKRENGLRKLLMLQLMIYSSYWMLIEELKLVYLWGTKAISGFDGLAYSRLLVTEKLLGLIALFAILPLLRSKLKVNEILLLVFINVSVGAEKCLKAFSSHIWQVLAATAVGFLWVTEWSIARTMFTRCIEKDEVSTSLNNWFREIILSFLVRTVVWDAITGIFELFRD